MDRSMNSREINKVAQALIKELKLEPGVNTLEKWMAHYIAELLSKSEKATGQTKQEIDKELFHRVLDLWRCQSEHGRVRSHFSTLRRYPPIVRTLLQCHGFLLSADGLSKGK